MSNEYTLAPSLDNIIARGLPVHFAPVENGNDFAFQWLG